MWRKCFSKTSQTLRLPDKAQLHRIPMQTHTKHTKTQLFTQLQALHGCICMCECMYVLHVCAYIRLRGTHRSDARLEGGVDVSGRLRNGGGAGSIDPVSVFQKLLPRHNGGLTGSELHREHLSVSSLDERRRSPRRFATATVNCLLFPHKNETDGGGQ